MPITIPEPSELRDGLLDLTGLQDLLGVGRTAAKCLVRRPDFPTPIRISQRIVRWRRAEVDAWLERHRSPYRPATHPTSERGATCPSIRRGRSRRHH